MPLLASLRRPMGVGATPPRRNAGRLFLPLAALAAAAVLVTPGAARADTSSTLTVVGTSDVSDSGLIQNVIQPAFQAAYPQYTFKYIGTATGTAITDAETGSVGASALIVHAASLENQFVAGGYSEEKYGRALWTNDFVLGGPTSDPAGVGANGAHNIAQAFADVAAAGIAGKAEFVSRGGTPGTTVEEHQIWQLVAENNLAPSGLVLCQVNAANGGGETPIAASAGGSNGTACPNGGALPTGPQLPSWYAATGLTQGPNVIAANACSGYASGANSCYVLTDRGTYDYLASGTDPAGSIPNLAILTRDDTASAPGGKYGLINYFHGYIINPSKAGETVNLTAAKDFLDLITSPTIQAQLADYLDHTTDPGGAPFKADASPLITLKKKLPRHVSAAHPLTISGTVDNAQPGYPALGGVRVSVNRVVGSASVPVKTVKTSKSGAFTVTFTPPASGHYTLSTPQFAQVENASLNPAFGDVLSPAVTASSKVSVRGSVTALHARSLGGRVLVLGSVSPAIGHAKGRVAVSARRLGAKGAYHRLTTVKLAAGDGRFAASVALHSGRWQIRTVFSDSGTVTASVPRTTTVTVRAAAAGSRILARGGSVSHRGRLTTHVRVSPRTAKGAKVALLVVRLTGGGRAVVHAIDTVKPKPGRGSVTLHGALKGSGHWAVLESYTEPGHGTTWIRTLGHVTIGTSAKQ